MFDDPEIVRLAYFLGRTFDLTLDACLVAIADAGVEHVDIESTSMGSPPGTTPGGAGGIPLAYHLRDRQTSYANQANERHSQDQFAAGRPTRALYAP
jgi:hypothetical protein